MAILSAPRAKALVMAAAIAGGLGLAGSAQAAGGCGPGFHPNPWGICRPNWGPRPYGYWRRPIYYGGYGYPAPALLPPLRLLRPAPVLLRRAGTVPISGTVCGPAAARPEGAPPTGGAPFAHPETGSACA